MSGRRTRPVPRQQARPRSEIGPAGSDAGHGAASASSRGSGTVPPGQPPRGAGTRRPAPAAGHPPTRGPLARLAALAVVGAAVLLGLFGLGRLVDGSAVASPSASIALATPAASPVSTPSPGATRSQAPAPSPSPAPASSLVPAPSPSGPAVAAAPSSAAGFDLRKTAIDIVFPIAADARYRYRDDFLIPRVGVTRRYNHARGISAGGRLLRAHDGVDIRARLRTRLHAAFSGTVIDPATRWRPWDPERYGNVVVIVSDEPGTAGYAALYAHLARTAVDVGDHVERGQVVGRLGQTGNAVGTPPHVHFELRAPFRIPVTQGGRERRIDAFDPFPSLVAADPKRRD